jgi:hypothetical protein
VIAALVVFFTGLAAVGYCTPVLDAWHPDVRFSPEKWGRGDLRLRGQMARSLASSRRLQNMTPQEVRAVLGAPDLERYLGQTLRYHVDLGYRWIISPYLYDLVVRFDKENRVMSVTVEAAEAA